MDELTRQARALGIADRVEARVGDMRRLDFAASSFDVIWCEGAIYNMGVEAALKDWRRLLVPGGYIALTEVCWTKPDPPADLRHSGRRNIPRFVTRRRCWRSSRNAGTDRRSLRPATLLRGTITTVLCNRR